MGSILVWALALVVINHQTQKTSVTADKHMIRQTERENPFIESLRLWVTEGDPCKLLAANPSFREKEAADGLCIRATHGYNRLPSYTKTHCNVQESGCKPKIKMMAGGTTSRRKWFCGFKVRKTGISAFFARTPTYTVSLKHCLKDIEVNPPDPVTHPEPRW